MRTRSRKACQIYGQSALEASARGQLQGPSFPKGQGGGKAPGTTDGAADWFCVPRFDSPSVFGALLDDERGGHFRIRPADIAYTSKQLYLPDTAVLVTRFFTGDGLGQVVDFMPTAGPTATDNHRI